MNKDTSNSLWNAIASKDVQHTLEIARLWSMIPDSDAASILSDGLNTSGQRRAAMSILFLFDFDGELAKQVFPVLVDLASDGHSDILLVRNVIYMMPRQWVVENIDPIARAIIERSEDYEEYWRFAELYLELDRTLLKNLVSTMSCHRDDEVRHIAERFREYL